MKDIKTTRLLVPKMRCEGCRTTILTILGEHPEIENPEIDLKEKTVQFSHTASLNPEVIKADLARSFEEIYTIE